ncbi:type III secretion protein [Billgrantia bachuensis]|uniref:Type III secretion protein n=1 Tax=Billgrantia bachuensis TaxID=2717286 RepID=A0ABX0PTG6_9GAMM|nr:type III secretion protein [Halomonas bachuensis]NIC04764.1 type III secretion protein [Halomonas bachuensis]
MSGAHTVSEWEPSASAWRSFVEAPARCIARPWLQDCLGGMADDTTLEALMRHPRFQRRLTQRLIERHGLTPPEALPVPTEEDARLLALPARAGGTLAHFCGVISHAAAFVREIRAPRVMALKQRFGDAAFAAALANRELAGATASDDDIEMLAQAVERDGQACVSAWLSQQPPELAAWLRLGLASGLPEEEVPDATAEVRRQGLRIVRCAAAIVDAEIRESEHAPTADTSG